MRIDLPAHSLYGDAPVTIDFPDSWDVQVASFQGENARTLTQEEIAAKIRERSGLLSDLVESGSRRPQAPGRKRRGAVCGGL